MIGASAGEGMWFARTEEREGTFVISNPDFNALRLPLVALPGPSPTASAVGSDGDASACGVTALAVGAVTPRRSFGTAP